MEDFNFRHFENSLGQIYCSFRYHEELQLITVTWKGTAQPDGIEIVKDEALELAHQKKCRFLINDFQDLYFAATESLIQFIRSGWDAEARAAGLRYILHVLKPEMEIPALPEVDALHIKFFYSKLEAVEWITQQLARMSPE